MSRKSLKIVRAYTRHYSDNDQTTAYVEWSDGSRTEGQPPESPCRCCGQPVKASHMAALFDHAKRDGLTIEHEPW